MDTQSLREKAKVLAYYDICFSVIWILVAVISLLVFTGATLAVLKPDMSPGTILCTSGRPILGNTQDVKDTLWSTWIFVGVFVYSLYLQIYAADEFLCETERGRDAADVSKMIEEYRGSSFHNWAFITLLCVLHCGFVYFQLYYGWILVVGVVALMI